MLPMLPSGTGIKESVPRARLWKSDTWHCEMCRRSSQDYPNIGWDPMENKIVCIECFLHWHEETDILGRWHIGEDRIITCHKPEVVEEVKDREYWYYWVWTLAPNHTIEEVRSNIEKFVNCDHGFIYVDISLEHGDESGREHYNMRIRSRKCIKAQRVRRYEKAGKINRQTIRKHTEENWDNVGNYVTKENPIEVLVA